MPPDPTTEPKRWWLAMGLAALVMMPGCFVAEAARHRMIGWPLVSSDMTDHLGAEYDNIGRAISEGRGFSDPFGRGDGPTAWMPPLIPYGLAALYRICDGDRDLVISIARLLQAALLWASLTLVLCPLVQRRLRWRIVCVAIVAVLTHLHYLLQITHDHTLLLFFATTMWWFFAESWHDSAKTKTAVASGIGGGVLALSSPVLGAVWAVLTVVSWRSSFRYVLLAAIVSVVTITPWMIRCRSVLGAWIPIKSNSAYEFWQAHVIDDDGVVDLRTFATHPYQVKSEDAKSYSELGEMRLLAKKSVIGRNWLQGNFSEYLARCKNRAIAAYVIPMPLDASQRQRGIANLSRRLWAILCIAAAFVMLTRKDDPLSTHLRIAVVIWVTSLVPYVLISYYDRYEMPYFGLKCFIILAAMNYFLGSVRRDEAAGSSSDHSELQW